MKYWYSAGQPLAALATIGRTGSIDAQRHALSCFESPFTAVDPVEQCGRSVPYLLYVTYFLLKRFRGMPRFNLYTKRVQRQLAESGGLLGYALGAKPWRKQFWTLSVWEDEKALRQFVHSGIHSGVMIVLQEDMADFGNREWIVRDSQLPPAWGVALEQLDRPQSTMAD